MVLNRIVYTWWFEWKWWLRLHRDVSVFLTTFQIFIVHMYQVFIQWKQESILLRSVMYVSLTATPLWKQVLSIPSLFHPTGPFYWEYKTSLNLVQVLIGDIFWINQTLPLLISICYQMFKWFPHHRVQIISTYSWMYVELYQQILLNTWNVFWLKALILFLLWGHWGLIYSESRTRDNMHEQ